MGFGQTDFPGQAGMFDGGDRAGAGAAIVAGNGHMIRVRLGDTRRDCADADFGHQLDADAGGGIHVLQVMNELAQILDGVDVMVRRRGDQAHARRRMTHSRNGGIHLVTG